MKVSSQDNGKEVIFKRAFYKTNSYQHTFSRFIAGSLFAYWKRQKANKESKQRDNRQEKRRKKKGGYHTSDFDSHTWLVFFSIVSFSVICVAFC